MFQSRIAALAALALITGCQGSPLVNALSGPPPVAPSAMPSLAPFTPDPALRDAQFYEDFYFKFAYPLEWKAEDLSLDRFAALTGAQVRPSARGKASFLAPSSGEPRVMMILFIGSQDALIADGAPTGGSATTDEQSVIVLDTKWLTRRAVTYPNGKEQNAISARTERPEGRYVLMFIGAAGVPLSELVDTANATLVSWVWK